MKIAYVSTFDARLVNSWSGTGYTIAKELEGRGIDIAFIGPLTEKHSFFYKVKQFLYQKILKKRHVRQAEPAILQDYARQILEQLEQINPDIVFAIWAYPIAFLECRQPIIFVADATFPLMHNYYGDYTNLSAATIQNIRTLEQSALNHSTAIIYSSQWAADSAIIDYGTSADKVYVVPFGAIIDNPPDEKKIEYFTRNRTNNAVCELLFLGVDWERKGGSIAFETMLELNQRGIDARLTVCGCVPPREFSHTQLHVIPYLDKNKENDRNQLAALLEESHFLLLPTRKEAYGLVFCEASAYGLPSITTNTGGVSEIIRNGINGYALPLDSGKQEYADIIERLWTNHEQYKQLSLSSFQEYKTRLNWNVATNNIKNILESIHKK